ncbi:MAG: hypothetical protein HQL32_15320, partial [Planctomycetes bacterium]|nr:hypothetical protein [Planctomycetota bacterium]
MVSSKILATKERREHKGKTCFLCSLRSFVAIVTDITGYGVSRKWRNSSLRPLINLTGRSFLYDYDVFSRHLKLLIVKLSALGDIAQAVMALRPLLANSSHEVHWALFQGLESVVENESWVKKIISVPRPWSLGSFWAFKKE